MWRTAICVAAALSRAGAQPDPSPSAFPFPVVGAKTGIDKDTGQPPARLDINTLWARGGPQWDLYLLALSEFQALNESNQLSYFAIAGIHGFPHSAWNGVGHVDGAPITGFCPHGEVLFVTWHRAYVALFEQVLVSHAVRIAGQYPSDLQPGYVSAAQALRQPYWDWASNPNLPPAVYTVNVTVRAPCGTVEIANPLYGYHFQRPAVVTSFGGDLAAYPQTIRCLDDASRFSNITASNEHMKAVAEELVADVYDIFARTKTFDGSGWRVSSFEFPHNFVHSSAVCNGTFSDLNWAAFDPLFMLHHCNVDRLVSMWQVINYRDAIFSGTANSTGQYGTVANATISADSPLKPFFDESLAFHTSRSVANITTFGYTYPEMPDWAMPPEARADHVRAQVNSLYSRATNRLGQARALDKEGIQSARNYYYTAEIFLDRHDLLLPATVGLVAGEKAVGHMSLLAMPSEGSAFFSVPIQDVLVGNQSLMDLQPARAVSFLQRNLTVEIRRNDGTEIAASAVPSLRLEVQSLEYTPRANDSSFPVFGKATRWPVQVRQHCHCGRR